MSLLPALRPRRRLSSPDWAWGGVGVTLATASASFAGYMIATAPAEVTGYGSRDFGIFAAFDRRAPQAPAAQHRPPASPVVADASANPGVRPDAGIDDTPTGTVPSQGSRVARSVGPLGEFHLRDVFGDHALIEHRSTLTIVQPGSTLAGAGEVLSIERQGRGWVVRTAAGVIGGL